MRRIFTIFFFFWCGFTYAVTPGLDSRAPVGAYMDGVLPTANAAPMPQLLSATGAFSNIIARTPHAGLVPYALNSPLWTDAAIKSRFVALPFDGVIGAPGSPTIGFGATGSWTFPNGTVIVKNFDLVTDERANAVKPVRRLETRILVRNADGTLRGATYKWNTAETDATRVDIPTDEIISIIQANGTTRTQSYLYPSPEQCLRCHNPNAGLVLGLRTAQLNGDFQYTQTGRTDNQLHTFSALSMLNTTLPDTATYPQYAKMAAITDTTATHENRVRSYLSSNCGHCHRPNGEGFLFNAEYDTPILAQSLVVNGGYGALIRRDLPNSRINVRDASMSQPMPPLARSVPDLVALAAYGEWLNYAYDIASVTAVSRTQVRVQFDRAVDPSSAADPGNYALDNGAIISQVTLDTDPSVVLLTTSPLIASTNYVVTVNRVKELAAPQNPIWPNTVKTFLAPAATTPGAPTITTTAAGDRQVTLSFTAPASDGGAAISSYTATCTPGPITVTSTSVNLTISVTGLTNGTTYDCAVAASNAVGAGRPSATVSVTPIVPPTPILTSVVSSKIHGIAGTFELRVDTPALAVESRGGGTGSSHTIVFKFDRPITSTGAVSVVQNLPASGAVASASFIGNEISVTLTAVTDNQRVTISLTGFNGAVNPTASATIGFLIGDVNNSQSVNSSDISGVKARSGQTTTAANFRFDVNATGSINSSDISAVKARSGLVLP